MDHYGIGAAIQGAVQVYLNMARGTGRTTSLVESLKTGDRVVFVNPSEARRVKELCAERGISITTAVIPPEAPESLYTLSTPEGRTVFDHSWVESYYMIAIMRASSGIGHLEQQTSGYGAAHRETKRRAEEMSRWQLPTPTSYRR